MEQTGPQTVPASRPAQSENAEATEFAVSRQDLLDELTQLQGVVERKTTIPILCNILMQTNGQVVHLTATDLDLSLRTSCPARVKTQGTCTIPARKLYDYVRLLPDGDINIKVLENSWTQLRCGRSHTKMVGLPRANFPSLPLLPKDSVIKLEADVLRNLISKTIFAISQEESRYTLNGALLVLKPQSITMVATDGHRMAHAEYAKPKTPVTQEVKILVPKKALAEVNSLLASSPVDHILFAKDDSSLFFVIGNRLLTSRQLTGTFPNYDAVLPRDNTNKVVVQRDEFSAAIKRVAQFSDERSNAIRIRLGKDELKLSSSTVEAGESEDLIQTTYSGDATLIGFNSQYLLEFLKAVGSTGVRLEFKGPQTAGELRPDDAAASDYTYRYVVMPLRV
jgi:DNA polymerase-3 subunit beta